MAESLQIKGLTEIDSSAEDNVEPPVDNTSKSRRRKHSETEHEHNRIQYDVGFYSTSNFKSFKTFVVRLPNMLESPKEEPEHSFRIVTETDRKRRGTGTGILYTFKLISEIVSEKTSDINSKVSKRSNERGNLRVRQEVYFNESSTSSNYSSSVNSSSQQHLHTHPTSSNQKVVHNSNDTTSNLPILPIQHHVSSASIKNNVSASSSSEIEPFSTSQMKSEHNVRIKSESASPDLIEDTSVNNQEYILEPSGELERTLSEVIFYC
ncbi:hypothetical protein GQR58_024285 [Nymphon striatum]|nr:hypothetical protein GQR58_024285 [Nymphon striatum]